MLILNVLSNPLLAIAFLVGILLAISVHEFAHALAAVRAGDLTPKLAGRLTLNPLAHLDPLGTLFLLLAGFGWGKPVPINPFNLPNPQKSQAWIALAGPLANIILALILAIPIRLSHFGLWPEGLIAAQIIQILQIIIELNLLLAVFNLLPIPPLDGSKIIFAFVSQETQVAIEQIGPWVLFALLFLSFATPVNIFSATLFPLIQYLNYLITAFPFS
ncbi:site-2 protease family protein [bacterium]|nr:site-2 protease family protein [bacterium]